MVYFHRVGLQCPQNTLGFGLEQTPLSAFCLPEPKIDQAKLTELKQLEQEAIALRKQLARALNEVQDQKTFYNRKWGITLKRSTSFANWNDLFVYTSSKNSTSPLDHRAGFNNSAGWNYNIPSIKQNIWQRIRNTRDLSQYDKPYELGLEHFKFEICMSKFALEAIKEKSDIPDELLAEVKQYLGIGPTLRVVG